MGEDQKRRSLFGGITAILEVKLQDDTEEHQKLVEFLESTLAVRCDVLFGYLSIRLIFCYTVSRWTNK